MAMIQRLNNTSSDSSYDITRRLPSLQFESALTDEEKELLSLRSRSHAITVSICAHSIYLADILSEVRQLRAQLQSTSRKTAMILHDINETKDSVKVGILGGGRLGSQIAHCLITFGRMNLQNLQISTRRPETLEYLQHKGVDCYYGNKRLVSSVDLLYICVLPSQLPGIADEIKGYLSPSTVVYCPSSSMPLKKLKQLLRTSNILKSEFHWTEESSRNEWDYNVNIKTSLEKRDVVNMTNPIFQNRPDNVVFCNPRLAEMMVCACVNMSSVVGLTTSEMLECVNMVILEESDRNQLADNVRLTAADFGFSNLDPSELSRRIDLPSIEDKQTKLQKKMALPEFIEIFKKRYSCVFEELHHLIAHG
ncbi:NADP-dependent oxidoreductase domain-containing protein 1 [Patella vulgata]|uniref:NADP-dependent oxidoreductase domain-containing protein 1 n=1 Tax=Patella vulgata TaxID=6465 RepID=UPI00218048F5|nr:NADP-dependent oxidoreductase domain-containing protein 1 [Patella vulgata]